MKPFQVRTLTMDPTTRSTGLPLKVSEWKPEHVFMITTHPPGPSVRSSLAVSLQLTNFHPTSQLPTTVVVPRGEQLCIRSCFATEEAHGR